MPNPTNKKLWSAEEIKFIHDNFFKMTNQAIADALGMKLTSLRTKCISMGLKRMELEYWNDEQVDFLRANYKQKGDLELSKIFENTWPKNKPWTIKHIEKKRNYLNLHRTSEQLRAIKDKSISMGVYREALKKTWEARGMEPDGAIHFWRINKSTKFFPVIKVGGEWHHWNRWAWTEAYGPIAEGMNVVFKDGDFTNLDVENLEILSNEDLGARNSIHRYPYEIRTAIRLTAQLDNKIKKLAKKSKNEEQKSRSTRSHVCATGKAQ